jgi:hypothetical protein
LTLPELAGVAATLWPLSSGVFDFAALVPEVVREEFAAMDAQLRADSRQTLAGLVERWRRYGDWVSSGREVHWDDYFGMLAARDQLQSLIVRATAGSVLLLEALVSEHDARFMSGTRPDDDKLLRPGRWVEAGAAPPWWWERVPIRLDRTGVE